MLKTTKKTMKQPIVIVRIAPGKATEHQSKPWMDFWCRLIAEVKASEKQ